MSTAHPLWRREMRAWLLSPSHYLMGAAFLFLTGVGFWVSVLTMPGRGLLMSEVTFGGILFWMAVVATASICSVRPMGEEQERGTLELLLTAPVEEVDIILIKFGTTVMWLTALCVPAVSYPWLLSFLAGPPGGMDVGAWAAGVLILLLVIGLVTATGLLFSQVLRRQSAAAVATFVVTGMVVFRGALRSWIGTGGADSSDGFALVGSHVASFAAGLVDSRAIIFYLVTIVALLFLNVRILQLARCRRPSGVMNLIVASMLTVVLVLMVNYVSIQHGVKWDWTSGGSGLLSGKTVEVLRGLKTQGTVTLMARAGDPLVPAARRLLTQYEQASSALTIHYVDPDVEIGRTRDLVRQYSIRESGALIVEFGQRKRVLYLSGFLPKSRSVKGRQPRGGIFLGAMEQGLTSAIHGLARETVPVVYFLGGHGERNPDDYGDFVGYSEIAGALRDSPAEVRSLTLEAPGGVSNDCSLLVIAGPVRSFTPWEVGRIRDYLALGGRLMVMIDAGVETGLESLLEEWGVKVGGGFVVDQRGGVVVPLDKGRAATGMGEVLLTTYGLHPVTRGMGVLVSTLTMPRPVEPGDGAASARITDQIDRPQAVRLALTSRKSWMETDTERQPPQYNEGYDRQGPLSVAVAVEKAGRSAIKMDIRPVRLVVIGDSQFAANRCLTGGNRLLFMNAAGWLLERSTGDNVSSVVGMFDLKLSPESRWPAFLLIATMWPVVMLSLAVLIGLARRDARSRRPREGVAA
jgi:hypothetical protein